MKIAWKRAKWRLATIWLVGGGLLFLILLPMMMSPKFRGVPNGVEDAIGWYLTCIMPNLSLIVAALVEDARAGAGKKIKYVERAFYRLALGLSGFYLLVVMVSLLGTTFTIVPPEDRGIAVLRLSNLWLVPTQALVSGILGFFFLRAQSDPADE